MSKQHLNTHVAELQSMADAFHAHWLSERLDAENPNDWPLFMEPGEWWEQFIAWAQTHADKPNVDA